MDATIAAALISGGVGALGIAGTVVASVVGSKDTRGAITAGAANTRATLAAAREDRLWEKRAAAYEETLKELLYRQAKRSDEHESRLEEMDQERFKDFGGTGLTRTQFEIQARLVAYGTDDVLAALNATTGAQNVIELRYAQWAAISGHTTLALFSEGSRVPDGREVQDARRQLDEAIMDALTKDDALIASIRSELRSRPQAAAPPPPLPAARRRFWLRHQELHR